MTPRRIVQADSLFETGLALLLIVGAAAGWLGPDDFPDPVGTTLILALGCALLPVGAVLWRLAADPVSASFLRTLAAANLATAAAALAWRLAAPGFSSTGSAVTVATAAALTLLAAVQLGAAGSASSRPRWTR